MNNKTHKIVLVEPSEIIAEGLTTMLTDSFEIVERLTDASKLDEKTAVNDIDIILINPLVLDFHSIPNLLHHYSDYSVVALQYSYIDSSILKQFNAVLEINFSKHKILETLKDSLSQAEENTDRKDVSELSEREKEILVWVVKGQLNKEIADNLNISIHTVISHRKNISKKTGIKSVSGLTVYALLNNLLDQSEVK